MAANLKRITAPAIERTPQTKDDVISAIAAIGTHQRERDRIKATMGDELAAVRERHEAKALPHAEKIAELTRGIQSWCEAHRTELTEDTKTKTVKFASGEVKWRMRPPSVVIRAVEKVIAALKRRGLDKQYVRVKEEINREAILAEPGPVLTVPGVTINQREDFVIVPFETQLEEIS
jgi:phage host-nuclease inhibitor protein Gam